MAPPDPKLLTREILLGFWKVHILHHAAEQRVFGQWILTELRRHGYEISPGTLYPLLSRMQRNGWLRAESEPGSGPRDRRYYHLTADGAAVLEVLRAAVVELHHEVVEEAIGGGRTAVRRRTRPHEAQRSKGAPSASIPTAVASRRRPAARTSRKGRSR